MTHMKTLPWLLCRVSSPGNDGSLHPSGGRGWLVGGPEDGVILFWWDKVCPMNNPVDLEETLVA